MKAIRNGGSVDISAWNLDVFDEAEEAFKGALLQIVKDGVNQALECAIADEGTIVFHDDGSFSLHTPLSNSELTTEPVFKFNLVDNVAEEISFLHDHDPDQIQSLERIRKTLLTALELLNKALT